MSVTIKEIAQKANVAISTVSYVLNNKSGAIKASEETRQRILRIAQELNYTPSTMAKGLRTGQSYLIGMLVSLIDHPNIPEIIQGVEDQLLPGKFGLLLMTYDSLENLKLKIDFMLEKNIDGAIIIPDDRKEYIAEQKRIMDFKKVVAVAGVKPPFQIPHAFADGEAVGMLAADHLLQTGHRQIAYFTEKYERRKGYRTAYEKRNLNFDETLFLKSGNGEEMLKRFLTSTPKPTAAIFTSDNDAINFIIAATSKGYRIPQDFSVIGTDNISFAKLCNPPLTTVTQSMRGQGAEGAAMLLDLINNRATQTEKILQPSLVIRQSCGKPSKEH